MEKYILKYTLQIAKSGVNNKQKYYLQDIQFLGNEIYFFLMNMIEPFCYYLKLFLVNMHFT